MGEYDQDLSPQESNQAASSLPQLGSLAQSARGKNLKNARRILIAIGVITILFNGLALASAEEQFDAAAGAAQQQAGPAGKAINQEKVREIKEKHLRDTYLICGSAIALGVVFILLGMVVYRMPVPATVLGLVLYVGAVIAFIAIEGAKNVFVGENLIWQIITAIALIRAVQSAIAYQRESNYGEALVP